MTLPGATYLPCSHEKSHLTPCVLRDGSQALAEAPYRLTSCVGCGLDVPGIADELQAIAHRYVPRKSIYTR